MDSTRAKVAKADPRPRTPKERPTAAAVLKFITGLLFEISTLKLNIFFEKRNRKMKKDHAF
jgi:hypothetical protein